MTAFVASCVQTLAGTAVAVERHSRRSPRARRLLATLAGKRNILITTHMHPDPDALGSATAMCVLLTRRLGPAAGGKAAAKGKLEDGGQPDTDRKPGSDGQAATDPKPAITLAAKGRIGGGVNEAFLRAAGVRITPWEGLDLSAFDAVVLMDTQPQFAFSPLPPDVVPTAVVDHHRGTKGRRPPVPYWDVRPDVGATSSIVFSYFMELDEPIGPELAATLLYAIESDLAGAAGTPGELDNVALSSLTLTADPRKLYQMRFTSLPRGYYVAYAEALANAAFHETVVVSHLASIESMEQPAVMADLLLRLDGAEWALVTAVVGDKLVLSLRTRQQARSSADVMRRVIGRLGEGGGHRTKAGGYIALYPGGGAGEGGAGEGGAGGRPPLSVGQVRKRIWKRLLCGVGLKPTGEPVKLVP
jgi:nanoRNase/pAp phosphatase (c-di-AMP/oligoRNAs hydrolase)